MSKIQNNMKDYFHKLIFKPNIVFSKEEIDNSFVKIKESIDIPTEAYTNHTKKYLNYSSTIFKVASVAILLLSAGFFVYKHAENQKDIVISNANELVKEIQLPDGSRISIRKASTISYNNNKFETERRVELQGEALFEVTKDKTRPFVVKTNLGEITVLGTVFSVRSLPEESYSKAILKEGSVKLNYLNGNQSVILKPGQEAILNENSEKIIVNNVKNIDRALAWQSHNFVFDDETLETIVSVISDAFDRNIEIKDNELKKLRLTLKFNRKESLSRILDVMSEVAKFKYIENKEQITIVKK